MKTLKHSLFVTLIASGMIWWGATYADESTESISPASTLTAPAPSSYTITWVESIDPHTLQVGLNQALPELSLESEANVLEDLAIAAVEKDETNPFLYRLTLTDALTLGSAYSIIPVTDGIESSLDFTYLQDNASLPNFSTEVENFLVVDSTHLEITFTPETGITNFEAKFFKEISSNSVSLLGNGVEISLTGEMTNGKNSILIMNLKDVSGQDLEIENSLYDFMPTLLNAAPQDSEMTSETASGENIEEVAQNALTTPSTGTHTNFLILLTLLLTAFLSTIKFIAYKTK